jgi:hypothetical protein
MLVGNGTGIDRAHLTPEQLNSMAKITYDNYLKNKRLVDLLAQSYGFHRAFFWQPTLLAGHKPLTADEIRLRQAELSDHPGGDAVFHATYSLFENYQSEDFFDLANIFDNYTDTIFVDFSHTGPAGNQMIADRMFSVLSHGN